MSDSSFDVDEILKEVRKRREENEARIKAQGAPAAKAAESKTAPQINGADHEEPAKKTQNEIHSPSKQEKSETADLNKTNVKKTEQQPAAEHAKTQSGGQNKRAAEEKETLSAEKAQKKAPAETGGAKQENTIAAPVVHTGTAREKAEIKQENGISQDPPENAPVTHYDVDENGNVNIMNYAEVPQTAQKKGKKAKKKASKLTKILRAVIIILLVLIIGGGAGIYLYINNVLDNATDTPERTEAIDEWSGMSVLKEDFSPIYEDADVYSYRDMIKTWYYNGTPVSSTHVLNVLLIGEDTRDENITDEETRADSAIIASVNIDTQQITLTSVLRDSYCYYEVTEGDEDSGRYGKINEAMMYGGIDCYIRAVENNFKINIDNYVIVNFDSFQSIIDTLGGITVEMTEAEIDEINNHQSRYGNVTIDAEPGLVDLNGEQALAYCRIRKIDSDNARADRQKTVLLQIFEKMKGASTVKSVEVVNSLLPYVKMGFDKAEVLDIGSYALRHGWLNYTTYTQTVPENATDENGEVITTCRGGTFYGTWCWKVDFPLTAQMLQQSIYGKTNITLAEDRPDFDELPLR